ncbi:phosphatase NudJ domain protein [Cooperia oncophora]
MVTDAEGRILLVREHRRELFWKFPGGPGKANENLLEFAARKVLEEAGVFARGETVIALKLVSFSDYF